MVGAGSGCSAYEPKPAWQTDTGCAAPHGRRRVGGRGSEHRRLGLRHDAGGWVVVRRHERRGADRRRAVRARRQRGVDRRDELVPVRHADRVQRRRRREATAAAAARTSAPACRVTTVRPVSGTPNSAVAFAPGGVVNRVVVGPTAFDAHSRLLDLRGRRSARCGPVQPAKSTVTRDADVRLRRQRSTLSAPTNSEHRLVAASFKASTLAINGAVRTTTLTMKREHAAARTR